ncbi:MAG: hypothetical protein NVSMB47_04780 [Polyangiales bacterium]
MMRRKPAPTPTAARALGVLLSRWVAIGATVAIGALDAAGCRTPTDMTLHVFTDVPCDKQRGGVAIAAGTPAEYETIAPAAQSAQCTQVGPGRYDLGTLVLSPHADAGDRIGIRVVLGVDHDVNSCTAANKYSGCVVVRRLLSYLPHTELTVDIKLPLECEDVPCDAQTTCQNKTCVGAEVPPDRCRAGCGEGDLGGAPRCTTPGAVQCTGGKRVTCQADGSLKSEDCGLSCSATSCVAASSVVTLGTTGVPNATCALVAGEVWCWGDNAASSLGRPVASVASSAVPLKVPGLPKIVQLAAIATSNHVVALDDAGALWCWGLVYRGECGSPSLGETPPTKVSAGGAPIGGAVQVAASSLSTCYRTTSGEVSCFGQDGQGQLGRGVEGSLPDARPIDHGKWSGVAVDLACASNTCCVLDEQHHPVCFGRGTSGETGVGAVVDHQPTPTPVVPALEVRVLRGGDNSFCAALAGGGVTCWGSGPRQLFLDGLGDHWTPKAIPGLEGKRIGDLAIGLPPGDYARADDGTVYGWGDTGLVTGAVSEVAALRGATQLATSFSHGCALVAGGIECWGEGKSGELGDGTTTAHAAPAPVKWAP